MHSKNGPTFPFLYNQIIVILCEIIVMQLVTYAGSRYDLILLVGESSTVSFLGAFANFQKATVGFIMSIFLSTWYNSAHSGWIFVTFYI